VTLLSRIENTRKVWNMLLPHVPPPADVWLAKWCAGFSDEIIENGISRVAYKFAGNVDNAERVHRYASSVLRNSVQKAATA